MNLDRFSPPNANDEIARCQSCGERFHYTQMDEEGFCPTCQPEEDETAMTEKEMRELDIWIGKNVFGGEIIKTPHLVGFAYMQTENDKRLMMSPYPLPHYTTDPAAAMQVLEKCVEQSPAQKLEIIKAGDEWLIQYFDDPVYEVAQEQTLPLAICMIAKKLFWHETKT